jgi:hypothetical protein
MTVLFLPVSLFVFHAFAEIKVDQLKPLQAELNGCPYPRSTLITNCTINPEVISFPEKISRPGDNWPVTWSADGNLYTFFADGVGLTPQARDFSSHPCMLWGRPDHATLDGRDIPSDAIGTCMGGDVKGRKVSGLLAIPDPLDVSRECLVAWVRNMTSKGGSSLMISHDHARTWNWVWGDPDKQPDMTIIRKLGHPSWVQSGRGNAAAPDDFLYFYSHAGDTAYHVADTIILGRVHKSAILDMNRYEYFSGSDAQPAWSPDIRQQRPVFRASGQCYRPFVTYHPVLKRYLLLTSNGGGVMHGHDGTHMLGIYEAKNPWGPWKTVYWNESFQPQWGVFAPQIVPAWISDDGKSCWLLYSCWPKGPYKFNLQRLVFSTINSSSSPITPH